jgi:hypothetical protein
MAVLHGNILRISRPHSDHSFASYQHAQTAMIPTPPAVKTRHDTQILGDSEL